MKEYALLLISTVLVNNFVLVQFPDLPADPEFHSSDSLYSAVY